MSVEFEVLSVFIELWNAGRLKPWARSKLVVGFAKKRLVEFETSKVY